MSICCAVNFTPASRATAEVAAHLASRRSTRLHLLHVLPEDLPASLGTPVREAFELALREECARLERTFAIRVTGSLLAGEFGPTLTDELERQEVDLLLVGAPRPSSRPMGLGGNLDRIAQAARVPLLRVANPEPWHAWLEGKRSLRVMLGVERSPQLEAAREWLRRLQPLGAIELFAGHVFYAPEAARRFGLPPPVSFDELTPALEAALQNEVGALGALASSSGPPTVRLQPGLGRVSDHLLSLAEQEGVDLLVLGSHERRGVAKLWSVSHQALRLASMSVAVVSPAYGPLPAAAPLPRLRTALAATDLSAQGHRAVAHAFAAVEPGGTVHLVHVSPKELGPEERQGLARLLGQLVPREAAHTGRSAVTHVLSGTDAAAAILETAERLNVDLLCLGSHGRTGALTQVLMGSVATRVVQNTRRPLLLVKAA